MKPLAIAIAVACLVPLAHAQTEPAKAGGGAFSRLDTDKDGTISRAEAQANKHLGKDFDRADANHDGKVTPDELHSARKADKAAKGSDGTAAGAKAGAAGGHGAKGAGRWDKNGDGTIERNEVGSDTKSLARFDAADANHDGRVTADEMAAARKAHRGGKTEN